MKIRSIHVEGFGVLQQKTLPLDGPLTVLYGRNEAGKSTLMGFIRAVLFGLPARSSLADRYEPPQGTAHGGYLILESNEGEVLRVERRDAGAAATAGRGRSPGGGIVTVTREGGEQGGEAWLAPLLGGITGELFRSLFAFSLSELQEVRTLQSEELSGYLYSAGLGARGGTIMQAERKLTLQMEQLYRPRGKNQTMNRVLKSLEEREADLKRSKEQMGRYNDKIKELDQWDQRIREADLNIRQLRQELARREAAEQARPHWLRCQDIAERLAELPHFTHFPEEALSRFLVLAKEQEQLTEGQGRLRLREEQLQHTLQEIALQLRPELLIHQMELTQCLEQIGIYRHDLTTIVELGMELEQLQEQVDKLLRQIEVDWREETLNHFSITVSIREQVRQFSIQLDAITKEQERHIATIEVLYDQQLEAKTRWETQQTKLILLQEQSSQGLATSIQRSNREEMAQMPIRLQQLKKEILQLQRIHLELKHADQRERDLQMHPLINSKQNSDEKMHPIGSRNKSRFPHLFSFPFLWIGILISISLPVIIYFLDQPFLAYASFILIAGLTILGFIYFRKTYDSNSKANFPITEQQIAIQQLKEQLDNQRIPLEAKISEQLLRFSTFPMVASAAEMAMPSLSMLVEFEEQSTIWLEHMQQVIDEWREFELHHKQLVEKVQEAANEYESICNQLEQAQVKATQQGHNDDLAQQSWRTWLQNHSLSTELSPTTVKEIFQLVAQGQQMLHQKQKVLAKRLALIESTTLFENRVVELLDLQVSVSSKPDCLLALQKWKEAAEITIDKLQQKQRLQEELHEVSSFQILNAEARLRKEERIRALWAEAAALNEEQFRLHARHHMEAVTLLEEKKQLDVLLNVFSGTASRVELESLLKENSTNELAADIVERINKLREAEQEAEQWHDSRGRLRHELESLEQGTEHSEQLQNIQEDVALLKDQAKQWATLAICSSLFKQARDFYEQEKQPGVLQQASHYFSSITNGQFMRIMVPIGEKQIIVERANGQRVDSSLLSRGTAEQLYLAMRFALADEYSHKAVLPLIMDDIFVNFDKHRLQSTVAVLEQVMQKHQILLFTCHQHVVQAIQETILNHQIINLDEK